VRPGVQIPALPKKGKLCYVNLTFKKNLPNEKKKKRKVI
jgi:hypothetical protein